MGEGDLVVEYAGRGGEMRWNVMRRVLVYRVCM